MTHASTACCAALLLACGGSSTAVSVQTPRAHEAPPRRAPPQPPPPETEPAALDVTLRWPLVDAAFSSTEQIAFFWDGDGAARVCADERCETVLAENIPRGEGGVPRAPAGALYWSVVHDGRASAARRFWIGARGPDFEPLATSFTRALTEPVGDAVTVRFATGQAPWEARVYECEIDEEDASRDPGCGAVVLRRGDETLYMPIDTAHRVYHPQLAVLSHGEGSALLVLEARGLAHHTDVWQVHLVELGAGGPQRVLRALAFACGWGDEGAECPGLQLRRLRPAYRDVDRDGDLDLELTVERRRTTFQRAPSGRFDDAEAWVDPEVAPPPE